jgi:hypothetical protein
MGRNPYFLPTGHVAVSKVAYEVRAIHSTTIDEAVKELH